MPQLNDGQSAQVPGKKYIMRNIGGVYDCSCIAWKMQKHKIDRRTCKHLCAYLGVENERARVGNDNMPTKLKNKGGASTATPAVPTPPAAPAHMTPEQVVAEVMEEGKEYPCLLADTWKDQDPTGWWMSEKLDGVRAVWDGEVFRSRNDNIFFAPAWFRAQLPKERLDGELWLRRDAFEETLSIVRRHTPGKEWENITFRVFDAPDAPGGFEDRQEHLANLTLTLPLHAQLVLQTECKGRHHLEQYLKGIVNQDGEGVMLRKPGSLYVASRSSTLLKVKPFYDMEVRVTGHTAGKGKHKGVLGALVCELDGKSFKVGGGLKDKERANPPPVGALITIKYQNLTKRGVPRSASFVRVYQAV